MCTRAAPTTPSGPRPSWRERRVRPAWISSSSPTTGTPAPPRPSGNARPGGWRGCCWSAARRSAWKGSARCWSTAWTPRWCRGRAGWRASSPGWSATRPLRWWRTRAAGRRTGGGRPARPGWPPGRCSTSRTWPAADWRARACSTTWWRLWAGSWPAAPSTTGCGSTGTGSAPPGSPPSTPCGSPVAAVRWPPWTPWRRPAGVGRARSNDPLTALSGDPARARSRAPGPPRPGGPAPPPSEGSTCTRRPGCRGEGSSPRTRPRCAR